MVTVIGVVEEMDREREEGKEELENS